MDKENMVQEYLYIEILFGKKKEWDTDSCYNMDETWKTLYKWKKPVTKDSTYMKYPE